jgi:3-mercaptopyruvate sulfurtransferase SseA
MLNQRGGRSNVRALRGGWNQWVSDKNPIVKGSSDILDR